MSRNVRVVVVVVEQAGTFYRAISDLIDVKDCCVHDATRHAELRHTHAAQSLRLTRNVSLLCDGEKMPDVSFCARFKALPTHTCVPLPRFLLWYIWYVQCVIGHTIHFRTRRARSLLVRAHWANVWLCVCVCVMYFSRTHGGRRRRAAACD